MQGLHWPFGVSEYWLGAHSHAVLSALGLCPKLGLQKEPVVVPVVGQMRLLVSAQLSQSVRPLANQYGSQCSVWETLSHGLPLA